MKALQIGLIDLASTFDVIAICITAYRRWFSNVYVSMYDYSPKKVGEAIRIQNSGWPGDKCTTSNDEDEN